MGCFVLEGSCLVIDMLKQFWILRLNSLVITLLPLKYKKLLLIPSSSTHKFLDHSKQTKLTIMKIWGLKLERV
jgi:hypothetical protein